MGKKLAKNAATTPSKKRLARNASGRIALLAVISGACGLAYEILFIRLFTNYFGDGFLVAGVTLCAVFLGIGFGAWFSARLLRYLATIEILIGLYAALVAVCFSHFGFEIAAWSATPLMNASKLAFLLGVPAFLIGTCVPLFSASARRCNPQEQGTFARIYSLYNVGAFVSVLAIEFWMFRSFGLQATVLSIAMLNLMVGLSLLALQARPKEDAAQETERFQISDISIALFAASLASGVFQLFVLQISFSIFGPLQENFAIILASAIGGVAIGAMLARSRSFEFSTATLCLALVVLVMLLCVPIMIRTWGHVTSKEISDHMQLLAKVVLLGGYPLVAFAIFGALVPLAVNVHGSQEDVLPGRLLAISSFGNGAGALLMFSLFFRVLPMPAIGIGIALVLLATTALLLRAKFSMAKTLAVIVIATPIAIFSARHWPHTELLLGYRMIAQQDLLEQKTRDLIQENTYKAFDQSASVLSFVDESRALVFNGYHSLSFGPGGKSDLHETVVGATPALFAKETNRALVLGLGTGISAGAAARVFATTTVAEINPAMINVLSHFKKENGNVAARTNVEILVQDGMSTILAPGPKFDAIVNTVTTPRFYAASKLYTGDFLRLAKSRLSSGGVYSTWFDLSMDRDGIAIMLNTLEANFETCRYFVMTASYFNAVCADHALVYLPSKMTAQRYAKANLNDLFVPIGFDTEFAETLSALEVSFDERFMDRGSSLVNSLDRPAIEFVVARQSDRVETTSVLSNAILANIEQQRKFSVGGSDWRFNCRAIAKMSGLLFRGC